MSYFSPYLIVEGAFAGVATGSLVVFGSMFAGSLVFGRLWCGWMCPAAGLQEPLMRVNNRRIGGRVGLLKWMIWVPWVSLIVIGAVRAGGYRTLDVLYGTVGGISVAGDADRPVAAAYAVYFLVVMLFFCLSVALGRPGGCHAVCWMAPFMIAGRAVRNVLSWPALRLEADRSSCKSCGSCTQTCPMSIDVQALVAASSMEHAECVLCGTCVDGCPQQALRFSFSSGK